MRNIQNGAMAEEKFRSEDVIERVSLEQKEMQYLYNDNEGYHFMDTDTYDQVQLQADLLGDMVGFLKPEMNVEVEFYGENPIGIELPQTVDLVVTQTMPAIKGATATNQTKPATLETGRRDPGPAVHRRRRRDSRQHRNGRIPDPRLIAAFLAPPRRGYFVTGVGLLLSTPESTVAPLSEIVWKWNSSPAISTPIKL